MIQKIRDWLSRSRVSETPEKDPRDSDLSQDNITNRKGELLDRYSDTDLNFFELEDKDTLYCFVLDSPESYIRELSEHLHRQTNFEKADIMFMKGKMGREVRVVETSPKDLFPNKFCTECGTAKMYDKRENETYCPFCSE